MFFGKNFEISQTFLSEISAVEFLSAEKSLLDAWRKALGEFCYFLEKK